MPHVCFQTGAFPPLMLSRSVHNVLLHCTLRGFSENTAADHGPAMCDIEHRYSEATHVPRAFDGYVASWFDAAAVCDVYAAR